MYYSWTEPNLILKNKTIFTSISPFNIEFLGIYALFLLLFILQLLELQ